MSNPFEDEAGTFRVLVNTKGQYSLWPNGIAAPVGWAAVYGPAKREACLDEIAECWTDLRPASLVGSAGPT
jgi:MbtH protein